MNFIGAPIDGAAVAGRDRGALVTSREVVVMSRGVVVRSRGVLVHSRDARVMTRGVLVRSREPSGRCAYARLVTPLARDLTTRSQRYRSDGQSMTGVFRPVPEESARRCGVWVWCDGNPLRRHVNVSSRDDDYAAIHQSPRDKRRTCRARSQMSRRITMMTRGCAVWRRDSARLPRPVTVTARASLGKGRAVRMRNRHTAEFDR
jgi:hypothetical protein